MTRSIIIFVLGAVAVLAQDGGALYKTRCAGCHDTPTGRVPTFSALRAMSPATIMQSLENGPMKTQAAGLTNGERFALVTFLASPTRASTTPPPSAAFCPSKAQAPSTNSKAAAWAGWGADPENARFQGEAAAGLTPADVPKLKLKWAFGLGDGASARTQPALGDGHVFTASLTGDIYSLDAQSGCIQWAFKADGKVHTPMVFGKLETRSLVFFGDERGNAYALDAGTGSLLWKVRPDNHFASFLTGGPQLYDGVLYVPVSSYEEALAGSPAYECCTFRGSVSALDAATGKSLWKTFTIPEAAEAADERNKAGVKGRGPSGAAVWSSPTIDEKLNVLYVATGDNYSDPPTATSDAVLAFDRRTGKLLWSKQVTSNDVYNMGTNSKGRDFDFGQPPILVSLPNGKRALVIGQKSGIEYALDPDRQGEILWQRSVGHGGALGGIQWGSAADSQNVYVALSDLAMGAVADKAAPQGYRLELDPNHGGGLFALRLTSGEIVWTAHPAGCGQRKNCSPAQSAAVTAIPGVVFSGSLDGHLRAYAAATGQVIWDIDTVRDYESVNGQKAHGGSFDVAGPVIADGTVYVNSGYGQWGGMPGNVLLAFSVDGR